MDILKELVRNIVVIIILGALFDMLMPKSNMNRYLRLVVGLFIIGAMINPLLQLTSHPDLGSVINPLNAAEQGENIQTILNNGQDLSKKNNERGIKEFQKRIEQQIVALVELDNEIEVLKASTSFVADTKNNRFGQLKAVNLLVAKADASKSNSNESIVAPIDINLAPQKASPLKEKQPISEQAKAKITKTITSFYGIAPELVHIQNP